MSTPIQPLSSYTDFQSLAKLRTQAKDDSQGALRAVAEQFESILLGMMVKSMRDASMGDSLFNSNAQNSYMDMYDKELTMGLSSQGGIGLADVIIRQLSQNRSSGEGDITTIQSPRPFNRDEYIINKPAPSLSPRSISTENPKLNAHFETPEQFVASLWPLAQQAADRLGVAPKVLISQAALETGWGKKITQDANGKTSYNLFNIKADKRWSGEHVTVATLEYKGGIAVQQQASFRAYDSYAASFQDYVDFISRSPRYEQALEKAVDAEQYIDALQRGGYATDPNYASKIKEIMSRDLLAVNEV